MNEIEISVNNFSRAADKLIEGIKEAESELDRDGVLQRFEFSFELFWKTLRLILRFEGFDCQSPRSCIKEAYRHGYITDGEIYLDMLEDRNLSSHIYDEQTSIDIFSRIKNRYSKSLTESSDQFSKYISDN
ncbi:MAG TPA: HI0074 family nucleotidyltransferase substrate-binding subunit [Balneolales bacterium]|nr:HI0074 family nucleotidyltransferase substrate-binding subunit [Balneolales bacterium]